MPRAGTSVWDDDVLVQMADRHPQTREELLQLSGVGPAKLRRYGTAFLSLLKSAQEPS